MIHITPPALIERIVNPRGLVERCHKNMQPRGGDASLRWLQLIYVTGIVNFLFRLLAAPCQVNHFTDFKHITAALGIMCHKGADRQLLLYLRRSKRVDET